jgi:hypothetical protein
MQQEDLYQAIVKVLSGAGEPVSHRVVRALVARRLAKQISSDEYFTQIEELSSRGAIERSRGQGGSVRLIEGFSPQVVIAAEWSEPALMPCLKNFLEREFWKQLDLPVQDPRSDWLVVDTSMVGSRVGQWTRPDFTAVSVTPFNVLPFPQLNVFTFELKAAPAGCAQAVHQALHQTKLSHFGYFVWHPQGYEATLDEIDRACKKQGIGLVLISDPQEPKSWEVCIEAERQPTSPIEIDQFLSSNRFTDAHRTRIRSKLSGA